MKKRFKQQTDQERRHSRRKGNGIGAKNRGREFSPERGVHAYDPAPVGLSIIFRLDWESPMKRKAERNFRAQQSKLRVRHRTILQRFALRCGPLTLFGRLEPTFAAAE